MTKFFLSILFTAILNFVYAQEFPRSWEGKWSGELKIYDSKSVKPAMNLQMELEIKPLTDSTWTWTIHYLTDKPDLRAYELRKATKPNQWIIDEKNGIQLTQTVIGNRLSSSFSLDKTLLITSYWLETDRMNFEIVVSNLDPASKTGLGNEESPIVGNHPVSSYHRAVMQKVK
ncbi:hypothetical protein D3C87_498840 [compost metagenome]